ncbi:MAG: hypothetical protein JF588_22285 [Caulobacterales bacterium]|nr:hypothetical protein [Caulobacterales bacterium]
MMRPQHIVVPTEDVVSALAAELAIAREGCARLDGALVKVLEDADARQRGVLMGELQTVDRLNQQLEALHTFLREIGCGAAVMEVGSALPAITLAEVADRLGTTLGLAATDGPPPPEGDCEYF